MLTNMSDRPLSPIPVAEADRAYVTLISAYREDPVNRWLYPDDVSYGENFPLMVAATADSAFATGTAWRLDSESAVALWIPPGSRMDAERFGRVLLETVPAEKHADLFDTLEFADAAHPPYPHWYLPWLGVAEGEQCTGLGTKLLGASLDYIDVGGLPAYLFGTSPRNIAFFERFGFVVQGEVQRGIVPALTAMVREGDHS